MKNVVTFCQAALLVVLVVLAVLAVLGTPTATPADSPRYDNDFETAELGKVPEDFLVLDGAFAVRKEGNNQVLELPGAPLESFGVLFGPTTQEDTAVRARIFGTNKGRRYPAFAVGLNGVGGYRLQLSPAKRRLELCKGDQVASSVPYTWKSGTWTWFRLQIRKEADDAWRIEGKAWAEADSEPEQWLVSLADSKAPYAGRASVWGKPYSGTPIHFDDFQVAGVMRPSHP